MPWLVCYSLTRDSGTRNYDTCTAAVAKCTAQCIEARRLASIQLLSLYYWAGGASPVQHAGIFELWQAYSDAWLAIRSCAVLMITALAAAEDIVKQQRLLVRTCSAPESPG